MNESCTHDILVSCDSLSFAEYGGIAYSCDQCDCKAKWKKCEGRALLLRQM